MRTFATSTDQELADEADRMRREIDRQLAFCRFVLQRRPRLESRVRHLMVRLEVEHSVLMLCADALRHPEKYGA